MLYNLKTIREEVPMKKAQKSEETLRDLLTIMPTLRKHQLDIEIHSQIKKLRAGRTQKSFTLELSRKAPITDDKIVSTHNDMGMLVSRTVTENIFRASAPLSRKILDDNGGKVKLLRSLKTDILDKVRAARKSNRHPIEEFTFREGVKVKKLAEVYLDFGTFQKLADKRVRLHMTKAKLPQTQDKHIGVEIEFACKQDNNFVCDMLFEAGVGRNVQVKRDGSIVVDGDYPHQVEVTILAKQTEIYDVIKKICDVLNTKLNVRIDKSCGLHVHVDMRTRDHIKSFYNLVRMQKFLYSMVPAKRKASRRENGYSQVVESPEWSVPGDHYYGINSEAWNKYKTLEIRMHCGTSQTRKINNWISLLVGIVDAPKLTSAIPDTIKDMQDTLGLSDGHIKYVESRLAKFASQHKKVPNPNWMGNPAPVAEAADEAENEASEVA